MAEVQVGEGGNLPLVDGIEEECDAGRAGEEAGEGVLTGGAIPR